MIKRLLKIFFAWIFSEEINRLNNKETELNEVIGQIKEEKERLFELNQQVKKVAGMQIKLEELIKFFDISIDVHQYDRQRSSSWAVISLNGKQDYLKFMNLGEKDLNEITDFIRRFERVKNINIDAAPYTSKWMKTEFRKNHTMF